MKSGNVMQDLCSILTPSFTLRPLEETDLPQVLHWRNDPAVRSQMASDHRLSLDEHRRWFDRIRNANDQRHWVVLWRRNPVGVTNARSIDGRPLRESDAVELGLYYGDVSVRGTLLAFVPAMMTIDYCFDELGVPAAEARVRPGNLAAIRFNGALGYETASTVDGLIRMTLQPARYRDKTASMRRLMKG